MPSPLVNLAAGHAAKRLPVLRRLPVMRLLLLGEIVLLAKAHYERLTPKERRRLVTLLRDAKGRPSSLSDRQRRELEAIVAKADASGLVSAAVQRLSPL